MANQLDFIKKDDVLKALRGIDKEGTAYNETVEYYIRYNRTLYPFKYIVEVASTFTKTPITVNDFKSDDESRRYIASLGFHILYKSHKETNDQPKYFVGASYYGLKHDQTDMINDFLQCKYWRTDHYLKSGHGLNVYNVLETAKINDRICIRYLDKKGGRVSIVAMGTISGIANIDDGRLEIIWDYNPPKYHGLKPSGKGSGNWWLTLFELKKHDFIEMIFDEVLIERRVARLAWNDNGWIMPSGIHGKSKDINSHEAKHGYGHEEWLFDTSKLINGYHYGFLEPVRKEQEAYASKIYNVWLYAIMSETKQRYWVGEIRNLIVIENDEAKNVFNEYVNRGWYKEMEEQIKSVGGKDGFSDWLGVDLFNVKFKPSDLFENDTYIELAENHSVVEQSRYAFGHFREEYKIAGNEAEGGFLFQPGMYVDSNNKEPKRGKYNRKPKAIEIVYYHQAISESLSASLKETYGKRNVQREQPTGYMGNRIDIVVKDNDEYIFYEIKTYNSIKTSIREALGQLLEYCFYPNRCNAKELIIVTQRPSDPNTQLYFKHLRQTLKLPIYYQSYDLNTGILSIKC